jgi:hypothetical protein
MKKLLIVAALLATSAVPATTVYAKDMAMPAASPTTCFFLPLMPDCMAWWKEKADEMKMATPKMAMPTMPKMTMPAMPAMPTCTRAPAGAGHLFDCTM